MSGMTRSMPSISSSGNIRPASTTTMSLPCSIAIMFLPISPTPPNGTMRSESVTEQRHLVGRLLRRGRDLRRGRLGREEQGERGEVRDQRGPQRGLMQRCRGVIHREDHEAISRLTDLSVDAGDRLIWKELVHGVTAERDDRARLQDLEMAAQPHIACGHLVGQRIAVLGWPVPDDVGDEDLRAIEPDAGEELVEELPGGADEGTALHVLVVARCLAEEEDARFAASLTVDGRPRAAVEGTGGAGADLRGQRPERVFVHPSELWAALKASSALSARDTPHRYTGAWASRRRRRRTRRARTSRAPADAPGRRTARGHRE